MNSKLLFDKRSGLRGSVWCLLFSIILSACSSETLSQPNGATVTSEASIDVQPAQDALDEVRAQVTFPIFIPTNIPENLSAGRLIPGDQNSPTVRIKYYSQDATESLVVTNGPVECCLDADPRKAINPVMLRNGVTAYILPTIEPKYGGPILWWVQENGYVAVSGPNLTQEELVRIANSMSKTATIK